VTEWNIDIWETGIDRPSHINITETESRKAWEFLGVFLANAVQRAIREGVPQSLCIIPTLLYEENRAPPKQDKPKPQRPKLIKARSSGLPGSLPRRSKKR
jgi:hypothetical protein